MQLLSLQIPDLFVIETHRIGDERGYFAETFRFDLFSNTFGEYAFVQENESLSVRPGTIRGMHFQIEPHVQGKLVRCTTGALFDVAVDIRRNSPTYGQWVGETLSASNGKQLWIPPGFAHGFCSLEPGTVISYKVSGYYKADCDKGVAWNDDAIGIKWPEIADPETLSTKDRKQPLLKELPAYFI